MIEVYGAGLRGPLSSPPGEPQHPGEQREPWHSPRRRSYYHARRDHLTIRRLDVAARQTECPVSKTERFRVHDRKPVDGAPKVTQASLNADRFAVVHPQRALSSGTLAPKWVGVILAVAVVVSCGLTDAEQRYNEGVDASTAGRFDDAVALYSDAIEMDPELAVAYVSRSDANLRLGRPERAIADATSAIELQPDDVNLLAQAHINRSAALGDRYEEALADDQAAIALQPDDVNILAQAYLNLAVDLNGLGRGDEAAIALAPACELGIEDPLCPE